MAKITKDIKDNALSAHQATLSGRPGKLIPENGTVKLTKHEYDKTEYHIPEGKKNVRSYFQSFHISTGGMAIDAGSPAHTLYVMEPNFPGHDVTRMTLCCTVPAVDFCPSQNYHKSQDCLLAVYQKGVPEPRWIGRPELCGNLTAVLPYERYAYGEYFLLVANLKPGKHCIDRFKKMGQCWRLDFEIMPNGMDKTYPCPDVSAIQVQPDNSLLLSLSVKEPSAYCRLTALFFNEHFFYLGAVKDVKPVSDTVVFSVPQQHMLTDGTYHVILQYNMYSYRHITLKCVDGRLNLTDYQTLSESSLYNRLSIDVPFSPAILSVWQHLYGCTLVKKNLLEFMATHDMDAFRHFAVSTPEGYVPYPKIIGTLLYGDEFYKNYDLADLIANSETAVFEDIFRCSLTNASQPLVLGVYNLSALLLSKDKRFLHELEICARRPNTSLILCGTHAEMEELFSQSTILAQSIPMENRWNGQSPALEEYIWMTEQILHAEHFTFTPEAAKKLYGQYKEHAPKIIGKKRTEIVNLIRKCIVIPYSQRTGEAMSTQPGTPRIIQPEDIRFE